MQMCDPFLGRLSTFSNMCASASEKARVKLVLTISLLFVSGFGSTLSLRAQSQPKSPSSTTDQTGQPAPQAPTRTDQQNNQNPFPEDTSDVPVIPTHNSPSSISDDSATTRRIPIAASDADPVRSPEDAPSTTGDQGQGFSSSLSGVGDRVPPTDDEEAEPSRRNGKGQQAEPEHHETAAEDESVGAYYLENKSWKAALSRYQSALVLDPENPDVYWGLAESQRHLGQFAEARANYQKVMEYDPGSHHAKEAKKALEDPQIANAKQPQPAQPSASQQ